MRALKTKNSRQWLWKEKLTQDSHSDSKEESMIMQRGFEERFAFGNEWTVQRNQQDQE